MLRDLEADLCRELQTLELLDALTSAATPDFQLLDHVGKLMSSGPALEMWAAQGSRGDRVSRRSSWPHKKKKKKIAAVLQARHDRRKVCFVCKLWAALVRLQAASAPRPLPPCCPCMPRRSRRFAALSYRGSHPACSPSYNLAQLVPILLFQLVEPAPSRLVRRNRIILRPVAAGVLVEVRARIGRGIDVLDVEPECARRSKTNLNEVQHQGHHAPRGPAQAAGLRPDPRRDSPPVCGLGL